MSPSVLNLANFIACIGFIRGGSQTVKKQFLQIKVFHFDLTLIPPPRISLKSTHPGFESASLALSNVSEPGFEREPGPSECFGTWFRKGAWSFRMLRNVHLITAFRMFANYKCGGIPMGTIVGIGGTLDV
ncbi:hypothetical protein CUU64_17220 [Bacillus sp. V5-8f]|nr:hypothetical protein CUU64_17220 [Bacillus sp. V5-8f]